MASRLDKVRLEEEDVEKIKDKVVRGPDKGTGREEKEERIAEKVKGNEMKDGGNKEDRIRELKALREDNREKFKVTIINLLRKGGMDIALHLSINQFIT